ncbi:MAG: hypothetical protein ACI9HK_001886 [Pirellulaceae bacterium]|jgi:hypothetical protein
MLAIGSTPTSSVIDARSTWYGPKTSAMSGILSHEIAIAATVAL